MNGQGIIAFFARNGVAANLLMLAIAVAGIFTLYTGRIPLEVFPELDSNVASIRVPYRGGTPEEIEESVVVKIEEAIADIEGITQIVSEASSSSGSVTAEIHEDYERRDVLDDIKAAVDSINTFPAEAERPIVSLGDDYSPVIGVVISADLSEGDLRKLGEMMRDRITSIPSVTSAELQGVRPYQIDIEISEATLQRYGLSFGQISSAIRASSIDLPAGVLETPSGDVVLRTKGRAYTAEDFAAIIIAANPDGSRITLGDLADVRDGFDKNPFLVRFNGRRCVIVSVNREGTQSAIKIASDIKNYMAEEAAAGRLPEGVEIGYWSDMSRIVKGRLDTLISSFWQSMLFIFLILTLFLRPTVAFWTVIGIPVCFLGAIALMPMLGVSINVISLFAFILVLGVVVDDAIVTGENIYTHQRTGKDPLQAATEGAQEVAMPVIFGVLTTMLAFVPIFFSPGRMGQIFASIPIIVIAVLAYSLIESKLILPSHLSHTDFNKPTPRWLSPFYFVQGLFSRGLEKFVQKCYQPALELALRNRYLVAAIFVAALILAIGVLKGGRVRQVSMPRVASEKPTARLVMQEGTPYEVTAEHIERIRLAALELQEELVDTDGTSVIEDMMATSGGTGVGSSRRRGRTGTPEEGEVSFYITAPETRDLDIDTMAIVQMWREKIGIIPGSQELTFRAEIMRGGDPIHIELTGPSLDILQPAAEQVKEKLTEYPGIFDITDSLAESRDEIQLKIRPEAQQFGLTMSDLARQVRQAFYGDEIQRVQRGRDELRVMLSYPEEDRQSLANLQSMMIRTPQGQEVPFSSVAEAVVAKSLPRITRIDRNRAVNVRADADKWEVDIDAVRNDLVLWLDDSLRAYPGVSFSMRGEAQDERENSKAMRAGALLIFFGIYAMLAIPFRSYTQPLIVMSVIPFGLIGALLGHMWLDWTMRLSDEGSAGMPVSHLSWFGMLALAGVVVNDSLVMVDYINRKRKEGLSLYEAARTAGAARFRPILLTSLTTFGGLYPLIRLESTHAQFLIPMAVSLGYGILFATLITLFLVPINYLMMEDAKTAVKKGWRWLWSKENEDKKAAQKLPESR